MSLLNQRPLEAIPPPAPGDNRTDHVRPADTVMSPVRSPARELQREVERSWSLAAEPRWSGRATLVFIAGVNSIFWGAAFLFVRVAF